MGVPITWDILQRSRRPSIDDIFPCFYYNRTTEAEYQRAKMVEFMECCVTKVEYAISNRGQIEEVMVSCLFHVFKLFHFSDEFSDSMNSFTFFESKEFIDSMNSWIHLIYLHTGNIK